jgi:hypothetical protein
MSRIFCTLILLTAYSKVAILIAQQNEFATCVRLTGTIINDSTKHTLPYVHLWNESTRKGDICNNKGCFSINARTGDTLVFSALGFYAKIILVTDSMVNTELVVTLKPQFYEVEEAVVIGYRNYESFKEQFIQLELPKTKADNLREHINIAGTKAAIEADNERINKEVLANPGIRIGLGKSSGDKTIRRIKELQSLKEKQRIINEKFNRSIVQDVTHLEADELTNFIAYCNFSEEFLYQSNLYDILEKISEQFELYKSEVIDNP